MPDKDKGTLLTLLEFHTGGLCFTGSRGQISKLPCVARYIIIQSHEWFSDFVTNPTLAPLLCLMSCVCLLPTRSRVWSCLRIGLTWIEGMKVWIIKISFAFFSFPSCENNLRFGVFWIMWLSGWRPSVIDSAEVVPRCRNYLNDWEVPWRLCVCREETGLTSGLYKECKVSRLFGRQVHLWSRAGQLAYGQKSDWSRSQQVDEAGVW